MHLDQAKYENSDFNVSSKRLLNGFLLNKINYYSFIISLLVSLSISFSDVWAEGTKQLRPQETDRGSIQLQSQNGSDSREYDFYY